MVCPQLLLLLAACISSASAYTSSTSYYDRDTTTITNGCIAAIVTLILGICVTFSGLKSIRLTFFVATLTVIGTIMAFTGTNVLLSILAILFALLVAFIKSWYKFGIFLLGMTAGLITIAVLVLVLAMMIALSGYHQPMTDFFTVCGIVALIISIAFGVRALKLEPHFLRTATSLLGGFTVSTSIATLISLNEPKVGLGGLISITCLVGLLMFALGVNAQKLKSYKNPFLAHPAAISTPIEAATPAKSQEPYVSAV